jgi:hypothetical protein
MNFCSSMNISRLTAPLSHKIELKLNEKSLFCFQPGSSSTLTLNCPTSRLQCQVSCNKFSRFTSSSSRVCSILIFIWQQLHYFFLSQLCNTLAHESSSTNISQSDVDIEKKMRETFHRSVFSRSRLFAKLDDRNKREKKKIRSMGKLTKKSVTTNSDLIIIITHISACLTLQK